VSAVFQFGCASVLRSCSFGICISSTKGRLRSATKNGALDVHLFERLAFPSRREV